MLPALVPLKNLIKTKSYHIDHPFFRLHYQATVCLLMGFCITLGAKVLFGDTIDCMRGAKRDSFWDNLCYATGTYTQFLVDSEGLSNVTFKADNSSRYTYTGLLMYNPKNKRPKVLWHDYYQYVPITLFIQAVLFYLPHYLWKSWENGLISSICKRLHENRFSPCEYFEANYDLIYYIQGSFQLRRSLVYKYYFCHVLCLLNLVLQIIALNIIFNYQFISYGYLVLRYLFVDQDIYGLRSAVLDDHGRNLNNPMDIVFPKITSCHAEIMPSAGLQPEIYEFICALPLNILHDKFFLILWIWFLILLCLTVVQIIYDIFMLLPFFRNSVFMKRYGTSAWDADGARTSSLAEVFLLDIIGQNSDKFAFTTLLRKLRKDDWTASPSENQSVV